MSPSPPYAPPRPLSISTWACVVLTFVNFGWGIAMLLHYGPSWHTVLSWASAAASAGAALFGRHVLRGLADAA